MRSSRKKTTTKEVPAIFRYQKGMKGAEIRRLARLEAMEDTLANATVETPKLTPVNPVKAPKDTLKLNDGGLVQESSNLVANLERNLSYSGSEREIHNALRPTLGSKR